MFKQSLSLVGIILLSVIVVIAMPYAKEASLALLNAHDKVSQLLTEVFSGGETGNLIRLAIALLIIPLAVALIPAILFWFTKRRWFPYFMPVMWTVWLVQTAALVALYKAV